MAAPGGSWYGSGNYALDQLREWVPAIEAQAAAPHLARVAELEAALEWTEARNDELIGALTAAADRIAEIRAEIRPESET
jgi:hypothetical protein